MACLFPHWAIGCIGPICVRLPGGRFDRRWHSAHGAGLSNDLQVSSRPGNGTIAAAAGFLFWGVVPIYWKQMQSVSALELIAHRIVWSLVFLFAVLAWQRNFASLRPAFAGARAFGLNLLSGLLLSVNWTIYVWAVNRGHVIETSLGYFLVPLGNVVLGSLILKEKLRPAQWLAIGFAAIGVALLLVRVGHVPWIALIIAGSWCSYGLLKKQSSLGSIAGLTVETLLLFPVAAALLLWLAGRGEGVIGHADLRIHAFVLSAGVITAVPLLLFAYGAQRMRLTALGLLQYLAPSVQFLIGLFVYHEPFDAARLQAFGLIWTGLVVYTADTFWTQRRLLLKSVGAD
jgi:chloramphenicol-sensitive protein RarD